MPTEKVRVRPVVIGGDIGAYGLARAFHEAFGVRTVVMAGVSTGAVAHSAIVEHRVVTGLDDDDTLADAVLAVAAEQPDVRHLVLGSADHAVHALVRVRERLEAAGVVVPYAAESTMAQVTTKAGFARLCAELDVPHPATVVVRVGDEAPLPRGIGYPAVVKASSSAQFHEIDFVGKRKVAHVADETALAALLTTMAEAGFTGDVVVQERLQGVDEDVAAVNAFCGIDGRVRFALFGQVLLEEATPNGLGNSVAQIAGGAGHEEIVGHAMRLLEAVGWTGFANIDLMRGPDGRYRLLELNPRVGRSGYAVTAAGHNVARMYVQAYLQEPPATTAPVQTHADEHLFTVVPLSLLKRYVSAPVWQRVRALRTRGAVTNVYYYKAERDPRRWAYIVSAMANQARKFARWHV